jgi:sugar lactone lactonase YvrE
VTKEPGGIFLDKTGNIVTADQTLPGILVFPPGATTPSRTFGRNAVDPDPVRFDANEKRVYVGDAIDNAVYVYDYSSGTLVDTITDGIDGPNGVALDPAAPLATCANCAPPARTSKGLIYVSDYSKNVVQIYPASGSNQAPIGQITDGLSGPEGSFIDKKGDFFVSNVTNYTVTMYPKGSTTWSLRYTGLAYPTNVTVGPDGMVYIPDLTGDKVVEYRKGTARSKLTLAVNDPQGVALDAQNNLYVSYNDTGGGHVNEYAPGSTTGKNLGLPISFAGGDAVDGSGNLLVADQGTGAVYVFPPGATTPSQAISVGLEDPFRIAFDKQFKHLYVADPEVNALLVFDYPAGTPSDTITNGLSSVYGVAVSPEGN